VLPLSYLRMERAVLRENGVTDYFFGIVFEFHLRGCEEGCDHFEDIRVAPRGIVESGRVNQNYTTTV
jgi:hypothetical protein